MKFRTLFISDTHLGSVKAQTEAILFLLKTFEFDIIVLNGDIVDIWQLKRKKYWPQSHTDIIRKILKRSKYSKVHYIIGNHDEFLYHFVGDIGNIEIHEQMVYQALNGKKYLILHGHQFDYVTRYVKWVAWLGDVGYEFAIQINYYLNKVRRFFGLRYWSLSQYLKNKIKSAVNYISDFEHAVAVHAKHNQVDGIIAGHIHTPAMREIEGIEYLNSGDFVEQNTALIEDLNGHMLLIQIYHNGNDYEYRILAQK